MLPQPPSPQLTPEQQKRVDKLIREGFPPAVAMAIVARGEGAALGGPHPQSMEGAASSTLTNQGLENLGGDASSLKMFGPEGLEMASPIKDDQLSTWINQKRAEAKLPPLEETEIVDEGYRSMFEQGELFNDEGIGTAPYTDDTYHGPGGLTNPDEGAIGPQMLGDPEPPSELSVHKYNLRALDDDSFDFSVMRLERVLKDNPGAVDKHTIRAMIEEAERRSYPMDSIWQEADEIGLEEHFGKLPEEPPNYDELFDEFSKGNYEFSKNTSDFDDFLMNSDLSDGFLEDGPNDGPYMNPAEDQRWLHEQMTKKYGAPGEMLDESVANMMANTPREPGESVEDWFKRADIRDERGFLISDLPESEVVGNRLARYGSPDEQLISMHQGRPPGFDEMGGYSRSWSPDYDFADDIYAHGSGNVYRQNVTPGQRDTMVEQTVGEPTGNEATKLSAIEAGIEEGRTVPGQATDDFARSAFPSRNIPQDELFRTSRRGGLSEAFDNFAYEDMARMNPDYVEEFMTPLAYLEEGMTESPPGFDVYQLEMESRKVGDRVPFEMWDGEANPMPQSMFDDASDIGADLRRGLNIDMEINAGSVSDDIVNEALSPGATALGGSGRGGLLGALNKMNEGPLDEAASWFARNASKQVGKFIPDALKTGAKALGGKAAQTGAGRALGGAAGSLAPWLGAGFGAANLVGITQMAGAPASPSWRPTEISEVEENIRKGATSGAQMPSNRQENLLGFAKDMIPKNRPYRGEAAGSMRYQGQADAQYKKWRPEIASAQRLRGQADAYKSKRNTQSAFSADRAMTSTSRRQSPSLMNNVRSRSQVAKNKSRYTNRYSGGFRK